MRSSKVIIACAVVSVSLVSMGCDDARTTQRDATAPPTTAQPSDAAPASNTTVRLSDIVAAPDRYLGQTVTVQGEIERVLTPMSFVLDNDGPDVTPDLLVFTPKAQSMANFSSDWIDKKARVTGTVGKMTVVEIEREVGWDLEPEIEAEVEKASAVLIARSVERFD